MKNLLTKLRYVPKRFAVVTAVVVAGATAALTFAWGPSRAVFTIEQPAPYVTFNSITNNPVDGDERNFSRAKDTTATDASAWTDTVTVTPGKEYVVRMVVHNNAADNLHLNAINTRASASVPTTTGKSVTISNFVSADNANPAKVWDDVTFTSSQDFNLAYVAGSARIYNNGYAAGGSGQPLPDSIVTSNGALLGYAKAGDGIIPGCFQYLSYVEYKVKPQFAATPNFDIAKTVRVNGATDTTFKENVSVTPGSKVDFQIYFNNTGQTQLTNVVIRDQLPAGMTYVPGTTWLHNSEGTRQVADGITTGGLGIGGYLPAGNAYLKFTAQLAANDGLSVCGENTLTNTASANTDQGSKSDTATVNVTKTCQPTPAAACKAITPHQISRTEFNFDGSATTENGATVSTYTYVVKNAAGTVVKTVTVNSTALTANSGTITLPETGVYTVILTVTTSLGDKTSPQCQTTVEVKPAPVVPVYVCNFVTVNQISRTQFSFATDYKVENATFVRVDYVVRNAAGTEIYRGPNTTYTQTTVGAYSVEAIVVVKVDGVEKTATSANCKKSFEVKSEDKDIQVCRLSDKVIVTIKESEFTSTKYSRNLDDCKPAPAMIKVCELATWVIKDIKASDFDASKYSKNLEDCKERVCELTSKTVITIDKKDFNSTKYSRNLDDCKTLPAQVIRVCELSTKKVVTIKESDFDAHKYSKTVTDCDTPQTPVVIANTGPEMVISGLLGSSALGLGVSSFIRSRRALNSALLNR